MRNHKSKMSSLDSPCSDINLVTSSSMLGLPEEVFLHVISYLDTRTKLSAAQVCKAWQGALDDWNLWEGVTARLSIDMDMNMIVPVLEKRRINRVHISKNQLQEVEEEVLEEGVWAEKEWEEEEDFTELCNLTRMMSNSLCSLDLSNLHVLNSKLLEALTPTMNKLTELILSDQPLYKISTYQTLTTSCSKLERLVCCNSLMPNSDVADMGITMPNLLELDLSVGSPGPLFSYRFCSAEFVSHVMPKLTKLNLSTCRITHDGLVSLSQLEFLQELNMQCCSELPDDCICVLSEGKCSQQLTVLNINHCSMMNSEVVVTSMADHPLPLTEFSISSYEWCSITDNGLEALLSSGKHLETRRLYDQTSISNAGLFLMTQTCSRLKTLVLSKQNLCINEAGIDMINSMASKPQVIYHDE